MPTHSGYTACNTKQVDEKDTAMTLNVTQHCTLPAHPLPIVSIGLGGIVHDAHYPAYRKAGFQVAGGYDLNGERARQMQQQWGIPMLFASLQEAVAHSPQEAVFDVAVPGHAILSILEQIPDGRAVLIQKPMGESLDEARAILKLCRDKGLTAAINFQMRYAPYIIAARSMIAQGLIGALNDIEVRMQIHTPWTLWPFLLQLPRLEILYHSIHYIDLIRSFAGNPHGVYAKTLRHPIAPDLAATRSTIVMDYGDQVRATILTNHGHVYGEAKQQSYVKWEGSHGAIQAQVGLNMDYPKGRADRFEYMLLGTNTAGQSSGWQTLPIDGSWFPDAFIGTMADLMRFRQGEISHLPTSVADSFHTMAVVEAAYESSERGAFPIADA
jgi:predicted dehydrogenase